MKKKKIQFEAVGCQIQFIGGSIYPKEEGFSFPCEKCGTWHTGKLIWDQDAAEFSLIVEAKQVEEKK